MRLYGGWLVGEIARETVFLKTRSLARMAARASKLPDDNVIALKRRLAAARPSSFGHGVPCGSGNGILTARTNYLSNVVQRPAKSRFLIASSDLRNWGFASTSVNVIRAF
jgi:hypothetical protein